MKCAFCGKPFTPRRIDAVCCSSVCATKFKNLEMTRGKLIYRAIYRWEADRTDPQRGANLVWIGKEIREWMRQDKALGRPPPPRHDHTADRGQQARKRKQT